MVTIKLNNGDEMGLVGFNRSIIFHGAEVNDNASLEVAADTDKSTIMALGSAAITSLQILSNNQSIYELTNINARIDNISDTLDGEKISTRINLVFDN